MKGWMYKINVKTHRYMKVDRRAFKWSGLASNISLLNIHTHKHTYTSYLIVGVSRRDSQMFWNEENI